MAQPRRHTLRAQPRLHRVSPAPAVDAVFVQLVVLRLADMQIHVHSGYAPDLVTAADRLAQRLMSAELPGGVDDMPLAAVRQAFLRHYAICAALPASGTAWFDPPDLNDTPTASEDA